MRVVFLHIPKTAGTSITEVMKVWYRDANFCGHIFDDDLKAATAESLASYDIFAGHFTYSTVLRTIPGAAMFTFLRDPKLRIISLYNYWLAHPWAWVESADGEHSPHVRFAKTHSFLEVLQTSRPRIRNNFDNFYVRTFAPVEFYDSTGRLLVEPRRALAGAIENARNLLYVGFVDDLDYCITKLASLLCQTAPVALPRRNTPQDGYYRPERGSFSKTESYVTELSEDEEAALNGHLELDMEFYALFRGQHLSSRSETQQIGVS